VNLFNIIMILPFYKRIVEEAKSIWFINEMENNQNINNSDKEIKYHDFNETNSNRSSISKKK
jgi:hypothetical protein